MINLLQWVSLDWTMTFIIKKNNYIIFNKNDCPEKFLKQESPVYPIIFVESVTITSSGALRPMTWKGLLGKELGHFCSCFIPSQQAPYDDLCKALVLSLIQWKCVLVIGSETMETVPHLFWWYSWPCTRPDAINNHPYFLPETFAEQYSLFMLCLLEKVAVKFWF